MSKKRNAFIAPVGYLGADWQQIQQPDIKKLALDKCWKAQKYFRLAAIDRK